MSMVSRYGALVSAYIPASKAFKCASVHRCSIVSSDLQVSSCMSPMIELRFGMYSRLKFSSSKKMRTPVMSVGGAISSSLMKSLGSGLRPYSDLVISEMTLFDLADHLFGVHDVVHFLKCI